MDRRCKETGRSWYRAHVGWEQVGSRGSRGVVSGSKSIRTRKWYAHFFFTIISAEQVCENQMVLDISRSINWYHIFFYRPLEMTFLETSALTGEGVEETFLKCGRAILTKIETGIHSICLFKRRKVFYCRIVKGHMKEEKPFGHLLT